MSLRRLAGATAVLACLAPATASAAPFANGSFEDPNGPKAIATNLVATNSAIPGWTVGTGSVTWFNKVLLAADGKRFVDLNGTGPGSVSQTFDTIPGATYKVGFALSQNGICAVPKGRLEVSADGAMEAYTSFALLWKRKSFTFVADDSSATLTFASKNNGCGGPVIDDVSVETSAATYLLESRGSDNANPPTITTARLRGGTTTVRVRGTHSAFAPALMAPDGERTPGFALCGPPEAAPLIPSAGGPNGRVGADAEWLFAYPQSGTPCNPNSEALLPKRETSLRFSTDRGVTWFTPTATNAGTAPAGDHVYTYQVAANCERLMVRVADSNYTDNSGQYEITVL